MADRAADAVRAVADGLDGAAEGFSPRLLSRIAIPEEVETFEVRFEVDPPTRDLKWQQPVELRLDAIAWRHGWGGLAGSHEDSSAAGVDLDTTRGGVWVAHVPFLNVSVTATTREALSARLEEHLRRVLAVRRRLKNLESVVHLMRPKRMTLHRVSEKMDIPNAPEAVKQYWNEHDETDAIFDRLGITRCRRSSAARAFEIAKPLEQLAEALGGARGRGVLLVGPGGVGKTALWEEAVRRAGDFGLRETPFWETDAALLTSAVGGFCDWHERCDHLVRLASKEKAIVHLGNLWELSQVGLAIGVYESVAEYLLPAIGRGELTAVCECTEEQFTILERDKPGLVEAFSQIVLDPPDAAEALVIYHEVANSRLRGKRPVTDEAFSRLDSLHRRFATYSSAPGRPLKFLSNLLDASDADDTSEVTASEITAAFAAETGLPHFLLEDSVSLDLEEALRWFQSRVMGQETPVRTVVDLLATVKARLTVPEKPIASLLFVGPTGVGKTELAKALAEFLYSDPARMVRIDMSEYAEPIAAQRLIGGFGGEGLLTAKVRQQPFGVVLLDEFEKAHESVFDLLLQVLGEGRLTDAAGRLADFRNSVVILTSNLGVEGFGGASLGFASKDRAADAEEHFTREASRLLRPEMLNRIDRIIPFHPLSRETLRRIVDRELSAVRRRHGLSSRKVTLDIGDDVRDELARLGHDPRYGARPVRRAVERHLLVPLAEALGRYSVETPLAVGASLKDGEIHIEAAAVPTSQIAGRRKMEFTRLELLGDFRRAARQLLEHHFTYELRASIVRADKLEKKLAKKRRDPTRSEEEIIRKAHEEAAPLLEETESFHEEAVRREEETLVAYYSRGEVPPAGTDEAWTRFQKHRRMCFHADQGKTAEGVLLGLYGKDSAAIEETAAIYVHAAQTLGFSHRLYRLESCETAERLATAQRGDLKLIASQDAEFLQAMAGGKGGGRGSGIGPEFFERAGERARIVLARKIDRPEDNPPPVGSARRLGMLLICTGGTAPAYFLGEHGTHRFKNVPPKETTVECHIQTHAGEPERYAPPFSPKWQLVLPQTRLRRVIDYKRTVRDAEIGYNGSWTRSDVKNTVTDMIERHMETRIERWLAE